MRKPDLLTYSTPSSFATYHSRCAPGTQPSAPGSTPRTHTHAHARTHMQPSAPGSTPRTHTRVHTALHSWMHSLFTHMLTHTALTLYTTLSCLVVQSNTSAAAPRPLGLQESSSSDVRAALPRLQTRERKHTRDEYACRRMHAHVWGLASVRSCRCRS